MCWKQSALAVRIFLYQAATRCLNEISLNDAMAIRNIFPSNQVITLFGLTLLENVSAHFPFDMETATPLKGILFLAMEEPEYSRTVREEHGRSARAGCVSTATAW